MEEKVVSMKDFKKEAKKREIKQKISDGLAKVGKFVEENPRFTTAVIVPVGMVVVKGIVTIAKHALSDHRAAEEQYYKDTHYYDPSRRHWWELRRQLTNREWEHFELRRAAGETPYEIFKQMDVLK